jgi:hypothetical protein
MTTDEYRLHVNQMEPGEALNKLVAEKIMGWAVHFRNTACYCQAAETNKAMTSCPSHVDEWRPSTNNSQAWEVLEAIKSRGNDVDIFVTPEDVTVAIQHATDIDGKRYRVVAPTFSEAMCKAALLEADGRNQ